MVARIDAPTLKLAKGLIDAAIETEAKGLKVRRISTPAAWASSTAESSARELEDYDRALLITAKGMKEQDDDRRRASTRVPNCSRLASVPTRRCTAAGTAWPSTLTRSSGSAGRGVPFGEQRSVDAARSGEPGVVQEDDRDGVAATMGPVYEPYLMAFPRPEQFFGILLRAT